MTEHSFSVLPLQPGQSSRASVGSSSHAFGEADHVRVNLRKSLFLLPNLITLSSVFCGFQAIVLCGEGASETAFFQAALLIVYAMFFDILDGRVARLTKTQSALGVQLDSLADVISFGVAPACLLYRWSLASMGAVGLAACFAFVSAGVIRLARFNVLATNESGA